MVIGSCHSVAPPFWLTPVHALHWVDMGASALDIPPRGKQVGQDMFCLILVDTCWPNILLNSWSCIDIIDSVCQPLCYNNRSSYTVYRAFYVSINLNNCGYGNSWRSPIIIHMKTILPYILLFAQSWLIIIQYLFIKTFLQIRGIWFNHSLWNCLTFKMN